MHLIVKSKFDREGDISLTTKTTELDRDELRIQMQEATSQHSASILCISEAFTNSCNCTQVSI